MIDVTLENLWLEPLLAEQSNRDTGPLMAPVQQFPFVIGRQPDCGYRIDHPYVSRRHCQLLRHGDEVWIQDLSSLNGTFVNGRRVPGAHLLQNGDLISICFHLFRINVRRHAAFTAIRREMEPADMHIAHYGEVIKP